MPIPDGKSPPYVPRFENTDGEIDAMTHRTQKTVAASKAMSVGALFAGVSVLYVALCLKVFAGF